MRLFNEEKGKLSEEERFSSEPWREKAVIPRESTACAKGTEDWDSRANERSLVAEEQLSGPKKGRHQSVIPRLPAQAGELTEKHGEMGSIFIMKAQSQGGESD